LLIVDRRRRDLEPVILSVGAAKPRFCRATLLPERDLLPPGVQLFDVLPMDGRFPPRSAQLIKGKTRVVLKWPAAEIERAIGQRRPGKRGKSIDEGVEFQRRNYTVCRCTSSARSR